MLGRRNYFEKSLAGLLFSDEYKKLGIYLNARVSV